MDISLYVYYNGIKNNLLGGTFSAVYNATANRVTSSLRKKRFQTSDF